jgi:hypothetical protein
MLVVVVVNDGAGESLSTVTSLSVHRLVFPSKVYIN